MDLLVNEKGLREGCVLFVSTGTPIFFKNLLILLLFIEKLKIGPKKFLKRKHYPLKRGQWVKFLKYLYLENVFVNSLGIYS